MTHHPPRVKLLTFPAATADGAPVSHAAYFPTAGQYLEIEALKLSLSQGKYEELMALNLAPAIAALDLIDAIAHFQVLCPDLRRELNFSSYLTVPLAKAVELIKVYKNEFYPWYWPQMRPLLVDLDLLPPLPKEQPKNQVPTYAGADEAPNLDEFSDPQAEPQGARPTEPVHL